MDVPYSAYFSPFISKAIFSLSCLKPKCLYNLQPYSILRIILPTTCYLYTMTKKKYVNLHEEALDRLCFVCGELISGARFYVVERYLDFLSRGLTCPSLFSIPDITPYNFCRKCHSSLSLVISGKTVQCSRARLIDWWECTPDCSTCSRLMSMKAGGKVKQQIKVTLITRWGCFCFFSRYTVFMNTHFFLHIFNTNSGKTQKVYRFLFVCLFVFDLQKTKILRNTEPYRVPKCFLYIKSVYTHLFYKKL